MCCDKENMKSLMPTEDPVSCKPDGRNNVGEDLFILSCSSMYCGVFFLTYIQSPVNEKIKQPQELKTHL